MARPMEGYPIIIVSPLQAGSYLTGMKQQRVQIFFRENAN